MFIVIILGNNFLNAVVKFPYWRKLGFKLFPEIILQIRQSHSQRIAKETRYSTNQYKKKSIKTKAHTELRPIIIKN